MRRIWGESLTLATANDQALLDEMHLRERWTAELSEAMQRKEGYDKLLATVAGFEGASASTVKSSTA